MMPARHLSPRRRASGLLERPVAPLLRSAASDECSRVPGAKARVLVSDDGKLAETGLPNSADCHGQRPSGHREATLTTARRVVAAVALAVTVYTLAVRPACFVGAPRTKRRCEDLTLGPMSSRTVGAAQPWRSRSMLRPRASGRGSYRWGAIGPAGIPGTASTMEGPRVPSASAPSGRRCRWAIASPRSRVAGRGSRLRHWSLSVSSACGRHSTGAADPSIRPGLARAATSTPCGASS